jgi:L-asparaginase
MKKIALIYMGGTFGCVGEPLSPMPAEQFLPQLQHILPQELTIECLIAPSIKDSSACTPKDWLALVQYIQALQQQDYQHFVIIHGTDTLSYAAAVLARFLGQSAHVVITGSQYPLLNVQSNDLRQFSDALNNLNNALYAVLKYPSGVYVAFHHHVLHAQTVLKQHSTELDAFTGLAASEVFHSEQQSRSLSEQDLQRADDFRCLNLMWQPLDLKQHIKQLQQICQNPPHVLILQGFGIGNLHANQALIDTLNDLYQAGCLTLLTSQVPFGGLDQRYAVSAWTLDAKILSSDCAGHADLYAKALKIYLQYPTVDERRAHWQQSFSS